MDCLKNICKEKLGFKVGNIVREELSVEEIHEGTIVIIKKLQEICELLNITYFVYYGSLIGAIRHKGFIPWDDDFDVAMLRPDYDKFVAYCLAHAEEMHPFKLIEPSSCKNYPYAIARLNDMRYEAEYDNILDYDSGLFVDIYPLDGAGNDPKTFKSSLRAYRNLLSNFNSLAFQKKYRAAKNGSTIASVIKYFSFAVAHLLGHSFFLRRFASLKNLYSMEASCYVAVMCWEINMYYLKKEWFNKAVMVPFEDIMVSVPAEYDKILRTIYGDYMQLPPEDKRQASHGYKLYRR